MKQTDKFKQLEFAQVLKGGRQILFIAGDELKEQTKYGLQALIGEKLGDGLFSIRYKEVGDEKTKHMNCRSVVTKKQDASKNTDNSFSGIDFLMNRFESLEKTLNQLGSKLEDKSEENFKLRLQLLEEKQNTGIDLTEVITNIGALLIKKHLGPAAAPGVTLADNPGNGQAAPGDLPEYIITLLSKIDWSKVQEGTVNMIFNQFKDKIPLKG